MSEQSVHRRTEELAEIASGCKYIAAGAAGALCLYGVLKDSGHRFYGVTNWFGLMLIAMCAAFAWAGYKFSQESKSIEFWIAQRDSETDPERVACANRMIEYLESKGLWKTLLP